MTIASILIIDDDETDQFICGYTIRRFDPDIKVLKAFNGREGLDALREAQPDAIILDINMPIMNGFEFLESYARQFPGPGPVIAMLTSSKLSTDRQASLQYDFVKSYFAKPLTADHMETLDSIVRKVGR
jgi:CheY-like chemotaxis protein